MGQKITPIQWKFSPQKKNQTNKTKQKTSARKFMDRSSCKTFLMSLKKYLLQTGWCLSFKTNFFSKYNAKSSEYSDWNIFAYRIRRHVLRFHFQLAAKRIQLRRRLQSHFTWFISSRDGFHPGMGFIPGWVSPRDYLHLIPGWLSSQCLIIYL